MRNLIALFMVFSFTRAHGAILWGQPISVGAGWARTFLETEERGLVTKLGVAFDDSALWGHLDFAKEERTLPLPVEFAPFDHVGLDFQPRGHAPTELHEPHFDVHFYLVAPRERAAIGCVPDSVICNFKPPADIVPKDYFPTRVVPNMGAHYYDKNDNAFCGGEFDSTFVFGYFGGDLVFIEPMVTQKLLKSRSPFLSVIKQPKVYRLSGAYPQTYAVDFDPSTGLHRVILQDFLVN